MGDNFHGTNLLSYYASHEIGLPWKFAVQQSARPRRVYYASKVVDLFIAMVANRISINKVPKIASA